MRSFLADDQPHARRPAVKDVTGQLGDPGAVADLAVRLEGRSPGGGRDLQDTLADRLGDRHADRVGQPPPALREPGDELMGAAGGVGPDQRPPPAPVALGQLGQGELDGGDVVGGRVRAGVPGAQEGGDGPAGAARPVVDEGRQRVMAVGLLPGRGRVLLVRMRAHQDAVEVDRDLSVGVGSSVAGQ